MHTASLIPKPRNIKEKDGKFVLNPTSRIISASDNSSEIAELMAESGQLDEAIVRMENLRKPFRDALESENYSNLWRFEIGIRFLLSRSEMAWRVDDTQAAGEDLDEALVQLQRLLESGHSGNTLLNLLGRARFLLWQHLHKGCLTAVVFPTVLSLS